MSDVTTEHIKKLVTDWVDVGGDVDEAEFDRWLAQHDREVAVRTLRETAGRWTQGAWANAPRSADRVADRMGTSQYTGDWLRAEADRIEGGTDE